MCSNSTLKVLTNCTTLRHLLVPPIFLCRHLILGKFRLCTKSAVMSSLTKQLFEGIIDSFQGVTVDSELETCSNEEFPSKLEASLKSWIETKRRAIWFKVSIEHADWVPILAKNGFNFHHAKSGFVMMYKWLPQNESCNIPSYANTTIGVGAVVVNDKNEVLVVSEKYINRPHWKLPGGYVEHGENLIDATLREVLEETGVQTEFVTLLTARHGHGGIFDCSNIYFVAALKPLTEDISKCEREIKGCEWMKVETYLNHPHVHDLNRFFVQKYLEYKEANIRIQCDHGIHQVLQKPYTVYHAVKTSNNEERS